MSSGDVLTLPALGASIELGQMYNARTGDYFAGVSAWTSADVAASSPPPSSPPSDGDPSGNVQNATFEYAESAEDTRRGAGLDAEGSLCVDVGLFKVEGAGKYVRSERSHVHEARVNVTCTVEHRTRRLPVEVLRDPAYDGVLADPRYTHFVAEVVEGGTATISCVTRCRTEEEARTVAGRLAGTFRNYVSVAGEVQLENNAEEARTFSETVIKMSGNVAVNVGTIADAMRVARSLPELLRKQTNTLRVKLLRLAVVKPSAAHVLVRAIDARVLAAVPGALDGGRAAVAALQEVAALPLRFPDVQAQVAAFRTAFEKYQTEFVQVLRETLPLLKDGARYDDAALARQVQEVIALTQEFVGRADVAQQFAKLKAEEHAWLEETIGVLVRNCNFQAPGQRTAHPFDATARLLLACGGAAAARHPLQLRLERGAGAASTSTSSGDDGDSDGDAEWFEVPANQARLRRSCDVLMQWVRRNPSVRYAVSGPLTWKGGRKNKTVRTKPGDIVLELGGALRVITDEMPQPPESVTATAQGTEVVTASWLLSGAAPAAAAAAAAPTPAPAPAAAAAAAALQPTGYVVRFAPRPNRQLDGINTVEANCPSEEVEVAHPAASHVLCGLRDNTDYDISVATVTAIGRSAFSSAAVARTAKAPSVAARLIEFFNANRGALSLSTCVEQVGGRKPWQEDCTAGRRRTLFLGTRTSAVRRAAPSGEIAVRFVDVAPEFMSEIAAHEITDEKNTRVLVFVGATGHGKSTAINAFISYMLGGDLNDAMRVLLIDDRGAEANKSVTRHITVYRVRPLSKAFNGQTLLIVDTPGYCDCDGPTRDSFITQCMAELWKALSHVNACVFTCKSHEERQNILLPVTSMVFGLFGRNMTTALRTVFTFSDILRPQAKATLEKLEWPVDNGFVEVNNAAFQVAMTDGCDKLRDWWRLSLAGQDRILQMLMRMPAVSSTPSAHVVSDRVALERRCIEVEKKVLRTAAATDQLLVFLTALAASVSKSPHETVTMDYIEPVQVDVAAGKHTTLCMHCKVTCHEVCAIADDSAKAGCAAMRDGRCIVCPSKCSWQDHKNATFIIKPVRKSKTILNEELVRQWNTSTNTTEGALLDAMNKYLELQRELAEDIGYLIELTERLQNRAIRHNPEALLTYLNGVIAGARSQGATEAQLNALYSAKNVIRLQSQVNARGGTASQDSRVLVLVLEFVRDEMKRRMRLAPMDRRAEEELPCELYNNLLALVPDSMREHMPAPLPKPKKESTSFFRKRAEGPFYRENLEAVVTMVRAILDNGTFLCALSAQPAGA